MSTVKFGDRDVVIERFTVAKGMRVITLLGLIQKSVPEINKAMAEFKRQYAEDNVVELDRVEAKFKYGPRPVIGEDGEPMFHDGKLVTMPSPIDRMTEQDWERAGQTLKERQEPSPVEMIMAVFPIAYEQAEQPVQRLLGLVVMPNDDVARYAASGEIWDRVDEVVAKTIAPAYLEEIMELAVAVAETIEGQVMVKAKSLGGRLGKLRGLFGMEKTTATSQPEISPTSSEQPETPKTDSASVSDDSSTGLTQSESSDSPGTPSTPSEPSSLASAT